MPLAVRIENRLRDVIAQLTQMMDERLSSKRRCKGRDVLKNARQRQVGRYDCRNTEK